MQADELHKICGVLGAPTMLSWPEGVRLAGAMGFSFPAAMPVPLAHAIPNASPAALDLMTQLCSWDPTRRPTAAQALGHPFFQVPP